jgi:hypothetical protein
MTNRGTTREHNTKPENHWVYRLCPLSGIINTRNTTFQEGLKTLTLQIVLGKYFGKERNSTFFIRFEVFMEATMKNAVFWDVMPCGSCKNQCFGGTSHVHHQGDKNRRARNASSN